VFDVFKLFKTPNVAHLSKYSCWSIYSRHLVSRTSHSKTGMTSELIEYRYNFCGNSQY